MTQLLLQMKGMRKKMLRKLGRIKTTKKKTVKMRENWKIKL